MEEKKNNAVEKVENIVNGKTNALHERAVEQEKSLAEKRIELAKLKEHKKLEREKAKASMLREKNRRKAELQNRKQKLKAERLAHAEALRLETEKDRQTRLSQKRAEKRRLKEEKMKNRQRNKEQGRSNGGWITAVVTLSIATVVLASALMVTFLMPSSSENALESNYRKAFYDTVEQVDNIDLNMSKILATSDTSAMQKYLVSTAINSELAENDLQTLPLHDESKFYTTKLVNQIGDYSKYLNNKLIAGETLTKSELESFYRLYQANLSLKKALQAMRDDMSNDYSFLSIADGGSGNVVISNFNELQNLSVEYPELIYDGPFSDGQDDREIKGISGSEISSADAKEIFKKTFSYYQLEEIEAVGETTVGIPCYNVQAQAKGELLYAQISKTGGKVIMFSYSGSCNDTKITDSYAVEIATNFLDKNGVKEMKPVWINLANNLYTINFAYEQNGVIVYSDLVKIRVCAESSEVIGMEATGYYTNHTTRLIEQPSLTSEQAKSKISTNIDVETSRLAVVPIGRSSEKLCYEFSGTYDGATYYVYVDAITGRQVEMFKVIESTEGTLLM